MASGCSDWKSSARRPPTNIEASACTRLIGRSSANQRGPGVPWMRALLSGPSGPATRPKSARPTASRTPPRSFNRLILSTVPRRVLCLDDLVVVGDGASPDLDTATAQFVAVRRRLFGIAYRMLGSRAEAEDIVQEVWVRWQNYDRS